MRIRLFLGLVVFSVSLFSQNNISSLLLGRWRLAHIEKDGVKSDVKDLYGLSDVYQIFRDGGELLVVIGNKSLINKWELIDDERKIKFIHEDNKGRVSSVVFNIIEMGESYRKFHHEEYGFFYYEKL